MENVQQERPHIASLIGPVAISYRDLEVVAAMASARFPEADADARRTALLDDVHRAGLDAGRILNAFVRHTMSQSRGTPIAFDVREDAQAFFGAISLYVSAIGRARDGFGDLIALRLEDGRSSGERARTGADGRGSACA